VEFLSLGLSLPPVASLGLSGPLLFIFDLLYKRVSSLPCISSAVCGFIYKAGQKPVSRNWGDP
jgi:hypothetical protein